MATVELIGRINKDGQIELDRPASLPPGAVRIIVETIDPDQAYYWTEQWQTAERKVDEEAAAGQVEDFTTMDDFLEDLFDDAT